MKQALYGYDNAFDVTRATTRSHTEGRLITALPTLMGTWFRRATTRRHLSTLTSEQLRDVGISKEQMYVEVNKPFWVK